MNRRRFVKLGFVGAFGATVDAARGGSEMDTFWEQWKTVWREMEAIAKKRGWDLTPLSIDPPASDVEIRALEARFGMKVPPQLRVLLTQYSKRVTFGWYIPSHLRAMEKQNFPNMSANRNAIWDIAHIAEYAIPNFLGWKRDLATRDLSEAPNSPEIWDNQFPFYSLTNGDMLTIDMRKAEGPHPVRYFSHDLETIHGLALAPDFNTFVSEMAKLGCAGTEWWSWTRFSDGQKDDTFYIRADSDGGKAWRAWIESDPAQPLLNIPPPGVVEATPADRVLLLAARSNSESGVSAALLAGAQPDCVFNDEWHLENMAWNENDFTAVTYAVRNNNISMLKYLLQSGATLNTRILPLGEAVSMSSPQTIHWLLKHGARVNRWKDDRYAPLQTLVWRRGEIAHLTKEQYREKLAADAWPLNENARGPMIAQHLNATDYLSVVELLLKAGADVDAPGENGSTVLMTGDDAVVPLLLNYGASVKARDNNGWTAMHWARTLEKARVLVKYGADVNARAIPREQDGLSYTPLQAALLGLKTPELALVKTLLELGAEPKLKDGVGRSTLAYCSSIEAFKLIQNFGLDPMERQPQGQTLLHNLIVMSGLPRLANPDEIAFFMFLLGLGIDINARNDQGQTMLHLAAVRESYDEYAPSYELLIASGADKSIKDSNGQRAFDLAAKSLKQVRAVLK